MLRRWQSEIRTFLFRGRDFTGGTFKMMVKPYRDAPGAALITLHNAVAGSEGFSFVVATIDGVICTTLTMQIDEATIDALLPYPAGGQAPDGPLKLRYDIQITPGGGTKCRWIEGDFIILPGVTQ